MLSNQCVIEAMMKATVKIFLQRADGWCESVKDMTFPLSELLVKAKGS